MLYIRHVLAVGVRKKDGSEYEPDSLTGIQNNIDCHMRDLKLPYSLKKDTVFSQSRSARV